MTRPMVLLAMAFVVTILGFSLFGQVARNEPASGQLLPSEGLLTVIAPRSGTLRRVLVKEGEVVGAGQPLFEISAERSSEALPATSLGGTLRDELAKQRSLLESDLIWINHAEASYQDRARDQAEHLGRQLALMNQQYALKLQQAKSAKGVLERVRKLDSGLLTAPQLQQYESTALSAEAEVKSLQQQRLEAQRNYDKAVSQQKAAPVDIFEQRSKVERAISDVTQAMARNSTDTVEFVLAPRAGVVSVMSAYPGQSVNEGARVLSLVPKGAVLEAELWAPSRAIGQLVEGGRVAMRYDAFPYRQFGHRYGRILRISQSALMPDEIRSLSGVEVQEPSYRVMVALDEQRPVHEGQRLQLRSNMTVDADLLLERQPLYRLLLPEASAAESIVRSR